MRLSKSKINEFISCSRKFRYRYIDKIEVPQNEYAHKGSIVHALAENVAKELQKTDNIDSDTITRLINMYYDDSEFDIQEHAASLRQFFIDMLIHEGYTIFGVEEEIYDEEYDLKGYVDIILEDEDGNLSIIDYKSSKKAKSIREYLKELCIYKYLVESKYPDRNVITAGVFFTAVNQYRCTNFVESQKKGSYTNKEDYDSVFDLIDWVRAMIDGGHFNPNRGFLCRYCDYQDYCEQEGGF